MAEKLSLNELQESLKNLSGWQLIKEGEALIKDYEFDNFAQAFAFMTQVALYAEKVNHHPEWTNIYNKVHIRLLSHDSGGVSAKDIAFALYMDEVAFRFLNPCMSDQSDLIF
jgi:4a-hydroxytetrahydrobiopterin dehydratase